MKKLGKFLLFAVLFTFVVSLCVVSANAEVIEEEAQQVDEVKDWFDKFFSPDKVAMYLSWVAYIGTIIGLVANIKKLKQANNLTIKNVSEEVQKVLAETIGTEVASQFANIVPKILGTQEKTNEILTIFAKILTLSQENTPESKVAILNLIEELGVVAKEIVDNTKQIIEEGQKAIEQHKEEINKELDECIEKYDGTSI